jgi:hypothetical protein
MLHDADLSQDLKAKAFASFFARVRIASDGSVIFPAQHEDSIFALLPTKTAYLPSSPILSACSF